MATWNLDGEPVDDDAKARDGVVPATMTEAEKYAFLDALGRETSSVIIAELQKIDGATQRDLLAAIESVVVHAFAAVDLAKGREGKLLKTMRDNAMRRLARHRMMQSLPMGSA